MKPVESHLADKIEKLEASEKQQHEDAGLEGVPESGAVKELKTKRGQIAQAVWSIENHKENPEPQALWNKYRGLVAEFVT